jgi:hypothetical protein
VPFGNSPSRRLSAVTDLSSQSIVLVAGLNFGGILLPYDVLTASEATRQKSIRLGASASPSVTWISDTMLSCRASLGSAQSLDVGITVGLRVCTGTLLFSFDIPLGRQGTNNSTSNLVKSAKMLVIVINALNLGQSDSTSLSRILSATEMTSWLSDSGVMCAAATGMAYTLGSAITAGRSIGSITKLFSYNFGLISGFRTDNQAPSRLDTVSIFGLSFGTLALTTRTKIGQTGCAASKWISDSSCLCKASRSLSASWFLTATSGLKAGTRTAAYSFDTIKIVSALSLMNAAKSGGQVFAIACQNCAPSLQGRNGFTGCDRSEWNSDTSVLSKVGSGVLNTLRLVVTSASTLGTRSQLSTYDRTVLIYLPYPNSPTFGSSLVVICGENLAGQAYSQGSRVSGSAGETTIWRSNTAISSLISSGVANSQDVTVTLGIDRASLSLGFSFDAAMLISDPKTQRNSNPSIRSSGVVIMFINSGKFDSSLRMVVGQTGAESSKWISDSSVNGRLPAGSGHSLRLFLTIELSRGNSHLASASYDTQISSSIFPVNLPSSTTKMMALSAFGVGKNDYSVILRLAATGSPSSVWLSDTSIVGKSPLGFRHTRMIVITTGLSVSTFSSSVSHDDSFLRSVSPVNSPAYSNRVKTILSAGGLQLLGQLFTVSLHILNTGCESTIWMSSSAIVCRIASGAVSKYGLISKVAVVTVGEVASSLTTMFTYNDQVASSLFQSNSPAAGTRSLLFYGLGFARASFSGGTRIFMTSCEVSIWKSDSSILGIVSAALSGASKSVLVTLALSLASVTEELSYDHPGLSVTSSSNVPATAVAYDMFLFQRTSLGNSTQKTQTGVSFSKNDATIRVDIGLTACEVTLWISDSATIAFSASGLYRTRALLMTVEKSLGSLSKSQSYPVPVLVTVWESNLPSTGSLSLTIVGSGFSRGLTFSAYMGATPVEATGWLSDSAILLKVPGGNIGSRKALITAGIQAGSLSDILSFNMPSLSNLQRPNGLVGASYPLLILGSGFGFRSNTAIPRSGASRMAASVWTSESSMSCRISLSSFGSSRLTISLGSTGGSVTSALSQDLQLMVNARPENLPTTGAMSLTVFGSTNGLFISQTLRQHITDCESSLWRSDSSVLCKAVASLIFATSPTRLVLSVGGRIGSVSSLFSILGAQISSSRPVNGPVSAVRSSMTMTGSEFGVAVYCARVRFGLTACESSFWASDSSLSGRRAKGDKGSGLAMVTAGHNSFSMTEALSYTAPLYKNQIGDNKLRNRPLTGTSTLTVVGAGFGMSSISPQATISVTQCEGSSWIVDTAITCKVVPFGTRTLRAAVTVGSQGASISESFSFNTPALSATLGGNRQPFSAAFIRIEGSGFGNAENSINPRISGTSCQQSQWISDSQILCIQGSTSHSGASKRMVLTVSRQPNSLSEVFSFDNPNMIVEESGYNFPSTGAVRFTMLGINFGVSTVSALSRTGITGGQDSLWISDSTVLCTVSRGLQTSRSVILTSGQVVGSTSVAFSFAKSTASRATFVNQASTGSTIISITGNDFGLYIVTILMGFGHTACESSKWTSTSAVACRKSMGLASSEVFVLTSQLKLNSMTSGHSYDMPMLAQRNLVKTWCTVSILVNCTNGANCSIPCNATRKVLSNCTNNMTVLCSAVAYNGPSRNAQELIAGNNFGLFVKSVQLRSGETDCEKSVWQSDTSIRCRISFGLAGTRAMLMTASMQVATISEVFSFNNPVVRAVRLIGGRYLTLKLAVQCVDEGQANFQKSIFPPAFINLTDPTALSPLLSPRQGEPLRRDNYTFYYAFVQGVPCVSSYVSGSQGRVPVSPEAALLLGMSNLSSVDERRLECQLPKSVIPQIADNNNNSWLGNFSRGTCNVTVFAWNRSCLRVIWVSDQVARCELESSERPVDIPLKCSIALRVDSCLAGKMSHGNECLLQDSVSCATSMQQNIRGILGANTPPSSPIWSIHAVSGFGMDSSSAAVKSGHTASPSTRWVSESAVGCRTAAGVHGTVKVIMSVGDKLGTLTQSSSYDASSLKTMAAVVNVPSTGSVSMTTFGVGLSTFGYTPAVRTATGSESSIWISDSAAFAKVAGGAGARLKILVTTGSRQDGTLTESLSYDSPNAYAVLPSSRPSTGVTTVSVIGSNLATEALSQQVRIGGTPCESARWISSTTLLCRVASGVHTMQQVIVTALQQTSNFPPDPLQKGRPKWPLFFFSYLGPILYRTPSPSGSMAYGSVRGGWTLTIEGANFGTASDLVRVSLGSNLWPSRRIDCRLVRTSLCVGCGDAQLSDSLVRCLVPAGDGHSLGIVMQVGDQTGVLVDGFSYSRPVVRSVASWDTCDTSICGSLSLVGLQTSNPSEGPYPSDPKVSRLLVVTGENLGVSNVMQSVPVPAVRSAISPTTVSIGSSACSDVLVSAAGTVLTCLAPAPRGSISIYGSVGCQALRLVVNVRNQTSSPASWSSLTYLENMPSVIPTAGSNVRGYAWMDGDGAGMTFQFGIQAGTKGDVWGPVRTNQGRQYLNRPGARSDDFAYICFPSPAPIGDTTCGKYLVSKVSSDLWSLIGADASCTWPTDSLLHVRFGFGATILPSLQPPAIIKIRPGVIMTFGAPSYAVDIDILVVSPTTLRYPPDEKSAKVDGFPSARAIPPRVILQSPAYIGPCDDLLVIAVVDYASGSRDTGLLYVWSSVPDLTPIRKTPTTGAAASSARVPWDDRELDYGVTYVVSVTVTNFLGQQGSASITVVREQIGVPTVMIPGGKIRPIRRDRMVVVNAAASLPACLGTGCTCVKSGDASSNTAGWGGLPATLEFQWAVPQYNLASAELHDAAALGTNSVLVIPASAVKMLSVGSNYTLKVEAGVWTGFAQNDINFYSTVAEVVLIPYSVPPVVRIRYGNRECSKANPLILDGSASFDPDSLGQQLKFEWYLDAGAMYDRLPLHYKEQRGLMSPGVVTRKSYINILQSASCTLSRMIGKTNLAKASVLQTNAAGLQESSSTIPDTDFELFTWGAAIPSPKPAIPWPVLVVIGLYVTDGDDIVTYNSVELSFYDVVSVAQEAQAMGVLSSTSFPISIEPLLDSIPIAENDLVLRVRLDDETIKKV